MNKVLRVEAHFSYEENVVLRKDTGRHDTKFEHTMDLLFFSNRDIEEAYSEEKAEAVVQEVSLDLDAIFAEFKKMGKTRHRLRLDIVTSAYTFDYDTMYSKDYFYRSFWMVKDYAAAKDVVVRRGNIGISGSKNPQGGDDHLSYFGKALSKVFAGEKENFLAAMRSELFKIVGVQTLDSTQTA